MLCGFPVQVLYGLVFTATLQAITRPSQSVESNNEEKQISYSVVFYMLFTHFSRQTDLDHL